MKISFVHLSDIHCSEQCSPDSIIIEKAIDALREIGEMDEFVLFFTGDLTYSGQNSEYVIFERVMSKFKKMVSILIVVSLIACVTAPMKAQSSEIEPQSPVIITPFWQYISSAQAGISASGTTVTPSVSVTAASSTQRLSGTLFLERQSGSTWVRVTSWSVSGTGTLRESRSFNGTAGVTYRARFVVTAGTESVERTSSSLRL